MATFAKSLVTAGNAYAGIGSRETPADICALMTQIARVLDARGMILRSGGADGADNAFAIGARIGHREIFTPWKTFQPKAGPFIPDTIPLAGSKYELPALHLAAAYHPTWDVYPVRDFAADIDWALMYGPEWGVMQKAEPASVVLAPGSEVSVYPKG